MDIREYLRDVHDAEPEATEWVIDQVTPVGFQVVGSPPKHFKSTFIDALPVIVANWGSVALPKWARVAPDKSGCTIMLSGEATAPEIKWLFKEGYKVQTHPATVFINDNPMNFQLDKPNNLTTLINLMDELNPSITIIDPLKKYHRVDENDSTAMDQLIAPLRANAIKRKAAIICAHHQTKAAPGATIEQMLDPGTLRGSSAIYAAADSIIMMRCLDRDAGIVRASAIHKRAAPWDRTFYIGCPGYGKQWKEFGHEVFTDTDSKVTNLLKHNSDLTINSIAKQLHLKDSEVQESLDKIARNR